MGAQSHAGYNQSYAAETSRLQSKSEAAHRTGVLTLGKAFGEYCVETDAKISGLVARLDALAEIVAQMEIPPRINPAIVTRQELIESVAARRNVSVSDIMHGDRSERVSLARCIVWANLRLPPFNYALQKIGRLFDRDHSTVIHGLQRVERLIIAKKITRDEVYGVCEWRM